ncbi:MAG: hypothetical protein ACREHC_07540 [Candidatus Levyibacteriota bacterium]
MTEAKNYGVFRPYAEAANKIVTRPIEYFNAEREHHGFYAQNLLAEMEAKRRADSKLIPTIRRHLARLTR